MKRILCWFGFHKWGPWMPTPNPRVVDVALHYVTLWHERVCERCAEEEIE